MRVATAEQALNILQDHDNIWCQSMAATPYFLLQALAKVALQKKDLTLLQLHTEHSQLLCDPVLAGHLRQRCFFVGGSTRQAVQQGLADYVPILRNPQIISSRRATFRRCFNSGLATG
ncbi:hypothetical protein [Alishewanella longhuensis]